ncbi:MAG: phenylalanine--tRNA ligase subunit beta [Euryarchaeota archaeon]|nr:phenylalanine--tRNA ligase subunit beta [Euryarchaeota archaeon]
MPVVSVSYSRLTKLLGKRIPKETLVEKIPMMGADVERVEGDTISVEFFPNRPDLYSTEGVARALRAFLGIKTGPRTYRVGRPSVTLTVGKGVGKTRPFIVAGVVRGVDLDETSLEGLIELQEDLHWGVGARRRKAAIGVHDLDCVTPPFVYRGAGPDEISFVPLQSDEKMTLGEVLQKHPKGVDYAPLLASAKQFPVILDRDGELLSLPPIINGRLTTVTTRTKNIFIDVTGPEERAITNALNIVAAHFAEGGARLEAVRVMRGKRATITPDLTPRRHTLDLSFAQSLIGEAVGGAKAKRALMRMGHGVTIKGTRATIDVPAYRTDIMHEVDLVEELAVGIGYWNLSAAPARSVTYGRERPEERLAGRLREVLTGLGFNEVMTLSLSSEDDQFVKMGLKADAATRNPAGVPETVQIHNPMIEEHTLMRPSLLPSLLNVLAKNSHRDLPQQLFELGDVVHVEGGVASNRRVLAAVRIAGKTGFTEAKSLVEAVGREIGVAVSVAPVEHGAFVPGRAGRGRLGPYDVLFGELSPATITAFGLGAPVIAMEAMLDEAGFAEK